MTTKVLNKLVNICTNLDNGTTSKSDTDHTHNSSYASIDHTHTISEVIDLQDTLDGKAEKDHTHKMSDITDLSIDLSGVASLEHTHTISEITNLQTTLDSKSDTGHNHDSTYAALSHTHTIANITNLQTSLNSSYATLSHTHSEYLTKSELIDLFYPIGSIYTSMNSTSPADIYGGTWTQITNRFLYCANSSGSTGGSSTLSEANLPSHTHTFTGTQATDSLQFRYTSNGSVLDLYGNKGIYSLPGFGSTNYAEINCNTSTATSTQLLSWTYTPDGTLSSTGSGEELLPPYITVYAWYRKD